MDAEGANVRQLTSGGFHTQPRWSPKGDAIIYTQRRAPRHLGDQPEAAPTRGRSRAAGGDNQGSPGRPTGATSRFSRTATDDGRSS